MGCFVHIQAFKSHADYEGVFLVGGQPAYGPSRMEPGILSSVNDPWQ
jgi:hypothetical protein